VHNTVIATLPTGRDLAALGYNPTSDRVYAANSSDRSVSVFDGAGDSLLTTIMVGTGPQAFAWNPVENCVYTANYWGSSISVIRDTTLTGIARQEQPATIRRPPMATINRGMLVLPAAGASRGASPILLNITGRRVAALHEGANDVRRLGSGVYFVSERRTASDERRTSLKIVIQH
jgi:YVTN family beta-propeller protein